LSTATFSPNETADFHRRLLLDDILPWWQRYAIDHEHGGLCSCIADDGTIQSHDKYVWSQVRALWTFSAAYNRIEKSDEYLKLSDQLFEFCAKFTRNADHDFNYLLERDGTLKEGPKSIQTDAFAICALVEYANASGNDQAIKMARESFARTLSLIQQPGSYSTAPYPIPEGIKAQRVSMQFSLAYWELGKLTGDQQILDEAMKLTDDVLDNFRRPELEACLEYMNLDNTVPPPPIGTYASGGHGIETAWFQIENLRDSKDQARLGKALDIMKWSFEKGWDDEYDGLLLGFDINGGECYLPNADTKIWWPHCEALCGALMAYEICGEQWCLDWYQKTLDYSLAHFPDKEHGEWTQRLDRQGNKINKVVALPVKDPFHLPRALVYAVESCERMAGQQA